jgi:hypothetical protein
MQPKRAGGWRRGACIAGATAKKKGGQARSEQIIPSMSGASGPTRCSPEPSCPATGFAVGAKPRHLPSDVPTTAGPPGSEDASAGGAAGDYCGGAGRERAGRGGRTCRRAAGRRRERAGWKGLRVPRMLLKDLLGSRAAGGHMAALRLEEREGAPGGFAGTVQRRPKCVTTRQA